MSLTAGVVGLPNVGKSTLFNAITKKNILIANYPFATIEPNVGVVTVPDKRLNFLEELYHPKKTTPTTFEFIDIAGLVKGASKGEGLGNQFLAHIKQVDAICEVVRCFSDDNITHVDGSVDPIRDIEIINMELIFSDLDIVQGRLGRIGKKVINDKDAVKEKNLLTKIEEILEKGRPIRNMKLDEEEQMIIKSFGLLTEKPIIYVANIGEEDLLAENIYLKQIKEYAFKEKTEVISMCAKVESEIADLDSDDKEEFFKDLGINESGLDKLIRATYSLLGLATYFTAGEPEVRAWTFKKGMKAPECAGVIHSDFEKGFIKAEIMSYDDLYQFKDEKKVKEHGKLRLEGKEYIMKDGDICYFRVNA